MKRAIALAGLALIPLLLAGSMLVGLLAGGKVTAAEWTRLALITVLTAMAANVYAGWLIALRPGADAPRSTWGCLGRATGSIALAVPIYFLLVTFASLVLQQASASESMLLGAIAAITAGTAGAIPGIGLQWALFHFTLPRAAA